jgi:signal transduction histidine kinase/CheY-like chemotaxis protein
MLARFLHSIELDPRDELISREIKETALRGVSTAIGLMALAVYVAANSSFLWEQTVRITLALLPLAAAIFLVFRLMERRWRTAAAALLVGLALSLALFQQFFPSGAYIWIAACLPALALLVTFRPFWSLLVFIAFGLLLWPAAALQPALASQVPAMLMLAAFLCLVLWQFARVMISSASWSMDGYRRVRAELEEIRAQRQELLQVRDDFFLANKELARLNDRLAVMTQLAEEARNVKEEFVARVSHELRTPLNMVIGFSEVIMRSPQIYGDAIPPALLADIDAIQRNSQHLSRLVDDILDLSQIEAGKMALTKEWVRVDEAIFEAVAAVRGLADTKGLGMEVDVQPDLPPVFCDGTRIRQVIINLLGNACRYTDKGKIAVQALIEDADLRIAVSDTGQGISEADQARIFKPFQQADTHLRKHRGGTGLGLAISKQFVEMHGGKMGLDSKLGEGTTFFFTLPLRAALDWNAAPEEARRWFSPYQAYEQRSRPAGLPPLKAPPRYVLLEQEDTLHRLFMRYLENIELHSVRTIADAIEEIRKRPAQALVVNVPSMDDEPGLVEQLGRLPYGTPVISCWVPGKEEAARELGVVEYLIKPVSADDLVRVTRRGGENPQKILIIDDEPELLRLFVRMLSAIKPEHQIIQAMNGRRALQLMRQRKPDMIILDLMMPEMDGFQVLHEKSHDPRIRDIPVVVVSSLNPRGETAVSKIFSVTRGNGLSIHELLRCMEEVTRVLIPVGPKPGPASAETPGESPAS